MSDLEEREKFGGKRRRVRQVEERARKKGGRLDKTGKSSERKRRQELFASK